MRVLRGKPISAGFAGGKAYIYGRVRRDAEPPHYSIAKAEVEPEHKRFHQAIESSVKELEKVKRRVLSELGETESEIFTAHLTMLHDREFTENIKRRVEHDLVNVEQAVVQEVDHLIGLLEEVESEFHKERANDIRDVGQRLLRHLGSESPTRLDSLPPQTVLIARELLPSETVNLDRADVAAIITEEGGETGHTAILARSLGIPAVTGIADITRIAEPGTTVLVDGETGTVTLAPSDEQARRFDREKTSYERIMSDARSTEHERCVTRDGEPIELLANIGRPEEADDVIRHNLAGVGLFRTEYLFLGRSEAPDEDSHVTAYTQAIERLEGRPLIIRTIDLGGDKIPEFIDRHATSKSAIGLRGLRYSLHEQDLFRVQLRGILKASTGGPVSILLPMVVGCYDLTLAKDIIREAASELGMNDLPPIGAMIETPASIFSLDEILEQVDFVSIGTNDLTQFILAADRNEVELLDDFSVLHPAVLRAVNQVVTTAAERGIPVTACGEAAGNPHVVRLFLGMGLRRLSMSPNRSARVRKIVRETELEQAETLSREALGCSAPQAVRELLESSRMMPAS